MPLRIVRNDITKMHTQAIVNTANEQPAVGTGCDSAIYKAAGYEELLAYRKEKIGAVPEGEVFITPGFALPAEYIIHAVSPLFVDGSQGEEDKLRSCYRKSLQLAKEYRITSIAFPLISTGGFGYPREEGMRIAVDEINTFLLQNEMEIFLVVFSDKMTSLGTRIYPELEEYIDRNYVEEKNEEEYGDGYFGGGIFGDYSLPDSAPVSQNTGNLPDLQRERRRCRLEEERERQAEAKYPREASPKAQPQPKKKSWFARKPKDDIEKEPKSAEFAMPSAAGSSYEDFLEEHENRLARRLRHRSDTFSEYLMFLIQEKNMENTEVYKRAIVSKKIFSKIKNNVDYHPQKLTALCLCVGAMLNLDESRDLLARAGYALSPCDKTDIIFSYFIENEIYDMIELDIMLEEHGLPCIIS